VLFFALIQAHVAGAYHPLIDQEVKTAVLLDPQIVQCLELSNYWIVELTLNEDPGQGAPKAALALHIELEPEAAASDDPLKLSGGFFSVAVGRRTGVRNLRRIYTEQADTLGIFVVLAGREVEGVPVQHTGLSLCSGRRAPSISVQLNPLFKRCAANKTDKERDSGRSHCALLAPWATRWYDRGLR
jgi:hypothetical protein